MPRIVKKHHAFTYGALDELMAERNDTKFLDGSLSAAVNVVPLPQGGYRWRGGTRHIATVRTQMTPVPTPGAGNVSAPNGGTAANLVDENPATLFTTSAASGDPFVVFSIDYGSAFIIGGFDLMNFSVSDVAANYVIKVQVSANASDWTDLGGAVASSLVARTRRISPPPGVVVGARYVRMVVVTGVAVGSVSVGGVQAWADTQAATPARIYRYNRTIDDRFQLVVTEFNVDIYKDGVWQSAAGIGVENAMLPLLAFEPSFDTLLFFHQDMWPAQIEWQGLDTEWNFGALQFENMPLVDYGGVYGNGTNEIQIVHLFDVIEGDQFELTLEGEPTAAITIGGSTAATASNMQAALRALDITAGDLTVGAMGGDQLRFQVTFEGRDGQRPWLEMFGRMLKLSGAVLVQREVKGKKGGEHLFGTARGFPAVGRFYQNRLIMAGFKSRPNAYLVSVAGEPFNLDTERAGATRAYITEIDADDSNTIREIAISSTLLFLTDTSGFWLRNAVLTPEDAPQHVRMSAPGIDAAVRPISVENAMIAVQREGAALREIVYSEIESNFLSNNASVLSASFIRQPRDMTLRRAMSGNDADTLWLVNADGTMTSVTLMRSQEVNGYALHQTDGQFIAATAASNNVIWLIATRLVGNVLKYVLERHEPDAVLDGYLTYNVSPASATVTGLNHFENRSVWIQAANGFFGPFHVAGTQVTLPVPVVGEIRVGSWSPPRATDWPLRLEDDEGHPMARLKRVFAAELSIQDTTSLAIEVNDAPAANVDLHDAASMVPDAGPLDHPVTGRRRVEGMPGFSRGGQMTVTQTFPGRLILRSVTKEIRA